MNKMYLAICAACIVPSMAFAQAGAVSAVVLAHAASTTVATTEVALSGITLWMGVASVVITAAATLAALFPQPVEGSPWTWLRKIIDILAINFGNAKNAK